MTITNNQEKGIIYLYRPHEVNFDGTVFDEKALKGLVIQENSKLFLDGNKIGKLSYCAYGGAERHLCVFFQLDNLSIDLQRKTALVSLQTKKIICSVCDNVFSKQSTPCPCIKQNIVLLVKEGTIGNIDLVSFSPEEFQETNVSQLISRHFAPVIYNIDLGGL